ncbi:hypothetical protein PV327_002426 [Microctonus hyperodae]|uniref:TATA element modulatory factor 1 TATA binding domain-containing protein n=1 Tax=Microctonus hyperodae TaxID=165561 RepID=A0AA39FFM7_MICHY|nr:hypothetical protein PV327_002426 [Microctonus hyperodae]
MSWFDASGFASLAKTALKEAQKTIDKALDIKEEEQRAVETPMIDDTNFFATWGIKTDNSINVQSPSSSSKQDTSIWGSFTGSFFETQGSVNNTDNKVMKNSGSLDEATDQFPDIPTITPSLSLPDRLVHVQTNVELNSSNGESPSSDDSCANRFDKLERNKCNNVQLINLEPNINTETDSGKDHNDKEDLTIRRINRVSIISSESDKKSSESVEILGSRSWTNTDCTTTPESDVVSASDSLSSSTVDPKKNSESVEILPDSLLTSPSSVEVLEDHSKTESPFLSPIDHCLKSPDATTTSIEPDSGESLQESSSDISPYASPMQETKSTLDDDTNEEITNFDVPLASSIVPIADRPLSPAAIEPVINAEELDEISQAEDSYTSASESTVMTIMETLHQQLDQAKGKMHESCLESTKSVFHPSMSSSQLETSMDSLKDVKQSLHLSLEPITTQPIRKTESLAEKMESFDPDLVKSATIEPLNVFSTDYVKTTGTQQEFSGQETYSTAMLTDSSCEGTLLDTSSEDNVILKDIKRVDSEISEVPLSSSCYVKNMLADAMVEKTELLVDLDRQEGLPREHSPISSESRSDLVKIGSDQASGHTSGDELETTTSSDIEIISSPNGDSSSTQSRQSPANLHTNKSGDLLTKTLKIRGHSRELSEISIGSDAGSHEMEKLRKRIQEINEILEMRESKLIDVSRINMDLHEQNNHLKLQLESWEKRGQQHQDLNSITDEYTQRMSALEKKFQQTIRERDVLKDQLEALKKELTNQSSMANIEKDEIIKQLREEGEKLSKQQLQHSNIIKKLRTKEKENELTIKNQKEQLDEQNLELDRLKRSLYAKEEVERSQIDAVHTLTARVKKQEKEISSLQEKLDNALHKMNAYKTSLDAAKTELSDTKLNFSIVEEELKQVLDNAGESCQLSVQVDDLKVKLRQEEEGHVKQIEAMKQENHELLKRLEELKVLNEEQSESVSLATKPLLRQIEQLQANLAQKSKIIVKQEKYMSEKIEKLQTKLDNMATTDRSLMEENVNLKSKLSTMESQVKRYDEKQQKLEESCEKLKKERTELSAEIVRLKLTIENLEKNHNDEIKELKRETESLRDKLSIEKAAIDAEKRKNHPTLDQQQSIGDESRVSPTSSVRRDSISSTNSVWLAFNDSVFDTSSGRFPNVYDGLRTSTNTTSTIETLQAQLKAREGEIQTLQWELSRRNTERDALSMELSKLTMNVEELSNKLTEVEALNTNLNEIQTRYDALLQMYGEKVEETEELRLDLKDVKDMYKSQIDQLLKRDI